MSPEPKETRLTNSPSVVSKISALLEIFPFLGILPSPKSSGSTAETYIGRGSPKKIHLKSRSTEGSPVRPNPHVRRVQPFFVHTEE